MTSIRRMVARANRGRISSIEAVDAAPSTGEFVGIGGAVRRKQHKMAVPVSGISSGPRTEQTQYDWRFSALDEDRAIKHMAIAATIADMTLWCALAGNRNIAGERTTYGRALTPADRKYRFGDHGHSRSPGTPAGYQLDGHEHLLAALEDQQRINPKRWLGTVALIRLTDKTELLPADTLPDDPYHVAFAHDVTAAYQVKVRADDFASLNVIPYYYEPTRVALPN